MKFLGTCIVLLAGAGSLLAQAAPAGATAPVQVLDDGLLAAMKAGSSGGFAGRVKLLDPAVQKAYDLPLMTRLVVGGMWRTLSPGDQQALVSAFGDYSVAVYASEFTAYHGDRFEVDPQVTALAGVPDAIVKSKLYPGGGQPVELDYRVRNEGAQWKIIDVLLNGTISQLAAQRSEFSQTLQTGGAKALVQLLRAKASQLGR